MKTQDLLQKSVKIAGNLQHLTGAFEVDFLLLSAGSRRCSGACLK